MTAKIRLSNRSKKKLQCSHCFFFLLFLSFSSLTLFSLSLFFSGRIFGLILPSAFGLFSYSKDCNFRTVRSKKSSKIMLCRLLRYTSLTFLKLSFRFLLVKSEWRGEEDSLTNPLRSTTMQSFSAG